jgi:tricorn protease interacting factor F2/3
MRNGRELSLTQKRFTYLDHSSDQNWMVPVTIAIFNDTGESREISTVLDTQSSVVDLGEDTGAYKINSGQNGFYRVKYAIQNDFDQIGRLVLTKQLPTVDRWGLQDDLFALVQGGDTGIEAYLDFLEYYKNEDADMPLSSIAGHLFQAYLVMDGNIKDAIAAKGKLLLEKIFAGIGYAPSPEEAFSTSILRDQILWHAVNYGSKKAEDFAARQFNSLVEGESVHPDILKSVMMTAALCGQENTLNWFIKRFELSESEHERLNVLIALGCFGNLDLIGRSLQYALENAPPRNLFVPIVSAAANPQADGYMWDWFVAHIEQLEKIHPLLFERVIAGIVPVCGLEKAQEVEAFLARFMEAKPQTAEVIKLSLEKLEINLRMRRS